MLVLSANSPIDYWLDRTAFILSHFGDSDTGERIVGMNKKKFVELSNSSSIIFHSDPKSPVCRLGPSPLNDDAAFHIDLKTFMRGMSIVPWVFFTDSSFKPMMEIAVEVSIAKEAEYSVWKNKLSPYNKRRIKSFDTAPAGAISIADRDQSAHILFMMQGKKAVHNFVFWYPSSSPYSSINEAMDKSFIKDNYYGSNVYKTRIHPDSGRTKKLVSNLKLHDQYFPTQLFPKELFSLASPMAEIGRKVGEINANYRQ